MFRTLGEKPSPPPLADYGGSPPETTRDPYRPTESDVYLDRLQAHSKPQPPEPTPQPADPETSAGSGASIDLPPLPWEMAPKAPPPAQEPGAFTRVISAARLTPPSTPAPQVPPEAQAPTVPHLPPPPAVAAPNPPHAPAGPAGPKIRMPVVVGIALVVLLTTILIVYLVMKSLLIDPAPAAPADPAELEAGAAVSFLSDH
jgi:hypothetical protein